MEALVTRDNTRSEELRRVMKVWEEKGRPELVDTQKRVAEKRYAEAERSTLAELREHLAGVGHDPRPWKLRAPPASDLPLLPVITRSCSAPRRP